MPLRPLLIALTWIAATGFLPRVPEFADLPGSVRDGARDVASAVIWLDAPKGTARVWRPQPVLDQRNLSFSPHVLAVQLGTVVEFPNHDRVFHNVFSDHDGKKFNLGLYPVGTTKPVPFDTEGLSRVFCNIHPQMSAYVMALDTPYFAVSDAAGRFTIPDVAAGTYTYHAWRSGASRLTGGVVTVAAGSALEVRW
jgi:plastocyanin